MLAQVLYLRDSFSGFSNVIKLKDTVWDHAVVTEIIVAPLDATIVVTDNQKRKKHHFVVPAQNVLASERAEHGLWHTDAQYSTWMQVIRSIFS